MLFRRSKVARAARAGNVASEAGGNVLAFVVPSRPMAAGDPPPDLVGEAEFAAAIERYERSREGGTSPDANSRIAYEPDGLHFRGATFPFPISIASSRIPFCLHFDECVFERTFDARWSQIDAIVFHRCRLRGPFIGSGMSVKGGIDFSHSRSYAQIDLAGAAIQGDLILIDAELYYNDTQLPSGVPPVRRGAALFCGGLRVHSVLMDKLRCYGRAFFDASEMTGILKAGDAEFRRNTRIAHDDFGVWDHMVLSVADSEVYGAVVLGEEAWGIPKDSQSFFANGQVNLSNSRLRGDLICTNGVFRSAYSGAKVEGAAATDPLATFDDKVATQATVLYASLNVSSTRIDGSVWLDRSFVSCGEVCFDTAIIKGTFRCNGAKMIGALPLCEEALKQPNSRYREVNALNLHRADIASSAMLNLGFRAFGRVNLRNAIIGGDLNCEGGTFHACWHVTPEPKLDGEERDPEALVLSGAEIRGSVFLSAPRADTVEVGSNPLLHDPHKQGIPWTFRSYGQVRLRGTRITRNLHLGGGEFRAMPEPQGSERSQSPVSQPLIGWFQSARVEGTTFFSEHDRNAIRIFGSMSFSGMQTGVWEDSVECWPQTRNRERCERANFELSGLTYRTMRGPTSGEERLAWLLHQPEKDLAEPPENSSEDENAGFKTQPWEQCANVLHELGYRGDARFLYRMEQRFIRYKDRLSLGERIVNFLLGTFVGHGYQVLFAFLWAVWLVGLGAIMADWAYSEGLIVPAEGIIIAQHERATQYDLPHGYPEFRPMLFSLDTALPAGNVRQVEYWTAIDRPVWVTPPDAFAPSPFVQAFNRVTLNALAYPLGDERAQSIPAHIARLLAALLIGALAAYRLGRRFRAWSVVPRFKNRVQFSRVAAETLYKRALYQGRSSAWSRLPSRIVFAVGSCVVLAWAAYLGDRDALFWLLHWANYLWSYVFHASIARAWFVVENLAGWLLLTAVAVTLGSTIFHYRRDHL